MKIRNTPIIYHREKFIMYFDIISNFGLISSNLDIPL